MRCELLNNREFQNLLVQRTFRLISLIGWQDDHYDVDTALQASSDLVEQKLRSYGAE